jgi:hypothetical protein
MREVQRIGGAAIAYPETPEVSEHFLLEENPLSAARGGASKFVEQQRARLRPAREST